MLVLSKAGFLTCESSEVPVGVPIVASLGENLIFPRTATIPWMVTLPKIVSKHLALRGSVLRLFRRISFFFLLFGRGYPRRASGLVGRNNRRGAKMGLRIPECENGWRNGVAGDRNIGYADGREPRRSAWPAEADGEPLSAARKRIEGSEGNQQLIHRASSGRPYPESEELNPSSVRTPKEASHE